MIKKLLGAGLTALCLSAGGVQAAVVTSTNTSFAFDWDYSTGTSNLTGFGSMFVSGFNSSSLMLSVSLTNTSLIGGQGGERLTHFGFGIDPNATGVAFIGTGSDGMLGATLGDLPGLKAIEVCAYGGNNCSGGSSGGIWAGLSDSFTLILSGTWGESVTIDPLGFKYQTGYGSFEFTNEPPRKVPEPTSGALLLLGLSLLAAGGVSRIRSRFAPAVA